MKRSDEQKRGDGDGAVICRPRPRQYLVAQFTASRHIASSLPHASPAAVFVLLSRLHDSSIRRQLARQRREKHDPRLNSRFARPDQSQSPSKHFTSPSARTTPVYAPWALEIEIRRSPQQRRRRQHKQPPSPSLSRHSLAILTQASTSHLARTHCRRCYCLCRRRKTVLLCPPCRHPIALRALPSPPMARHINSSWITSSHIRAAMKFP